MNQAISRCAIGDPKATLILNFWAIFQRNSKTNGGGEKQNEKLCQNVCSKETEPPKSNLSTTSISFSPDFDDSILKITNVCSIQASDFSETEQSNDLLKLLEKENENILEEQNEKLCQNIC